MKKPWDEKQEAELVRLLAEGNSINEIGVKLHRTKAAVKSKIAALGLNKQNKWSIEEEQILVKYLYLGMSHHQIAALINRSVPAIRSRLASSNLFEKYPELNPHNIRKQYVIRKRRRV